MPALGLALGLPFSQRLEGLFPSGVVQWLAAPDSDGAITDKRSLLSHPVYTGNNCKKFDGVGDWLSINHPDVNFVIGRPMRVEIFCALTTTTADKIIFASTSSSSNRLVLKRSYAAHTTLVAGIYMDRKYVQVQEINGVTENVPVRINLDYDGTTLTASLDGINFSPSVQALASTPAPGTTFFSRTDGKVNCAAICSYAKITPGPEYTFAAGPSLIEWDGSGGGYHGTYTTTSGIDAMATTSDKATPWNILNGFSLYTHATLPVLRVPYDINGDPLSITPPTGYTLVSEHPGGYLHNGAESTITQTDNFFIDGTINFYSADGATQDDKTYADFLAHEPFKDNLLLQWKSVGGVCLGCEAMQLPLAYTWTKAKYNAALAFMHEFTSDCGAKIFTVTEPTGGWLRTYDPNTATAGDAYDFLATLVHDMHTGFPTYAVTEPTGGWVRTFDSMDADLTLGTVQDVLATVAHDIGSTVQAYALNTGGTELYTYNPNTATFNNAANVLYSLMLKLKHFGFIL